MAQCTQSEEDALVDQPLKERSRLAATSAKSSEPRFCAYPENRERPWKITLKRRLARSQRGSAAVKLSRLLAGSPCVKCDIEPGIRGFAQFNGSPIYAIYRIASS